MYEMDNGYDILAACKYNIFFIAYSLRIILNSLIIICTAILKNNFLITMI